MTDIVNGSLRMLGDRILLKPLEWDASKTVIAIRHGRPVRGEVMAVGPGCYPNRYKSGKRDGKDFRKSYATKAFRPTEVKVGDVVELGGLNIFDGKGYIYQEVMVGTERHLIVSEKDVACVRDDQVHPVADPICATVDCSNIVESSEDYCTWCLDAQVAKASGARNG